MFGFSKIFHYLIIKFIESECKEPVKSGVPIMSHPAPYCTYYSLIIIIPLHEITYHGIFKYYNQMFKVKLNKSVN